jgi:hypothetical protein
MGKKLDKVDQLILREAIFLLFMQHKRTDTLDYPHAGWWIWHTVAITGVYMLGKMVKRCHHSDMES